jgi:hypothetical protein
MRYLFNWLAVFGLYCLFLNPLQAAELAYYSFDTDFNDYSGNGQHGTATGPGATITNASGDFVFGGGAANFTAARDYIDIPNITRGSGNPYSVSFWAKDATAGSAGDGGMVIGQPDSTGFFIWLNGPGTDLRWRSTDNSANRQADFAFPVDDDGAWHHYTIVAGDYDLDSAIDDITLYRDGAFVGTDPNNLTGFIFDSIGEAYTTSINLDFIGQIDEVRIYDESLTAEQVNNLFQFNNVDGQVPEPTGLAAWLVVGLGALWVRKRPTSQKGSSQG